VGRLGSEVRVSASFRSFALRMLLLHSVVVASLKQKCELNTLSDPPLPLEGTVSSSIDAFFGCGLKLQQFVPVLLAT